MDGNGRWAARQGLPRGAGHQAGAEALRAVVEAAPEA
ncbi:MAG TPA: undecaprenyl diphosphate synthase family protein, partial [Gemmatimonadales bacterium]|nr:undecaprenyl diphosphate synthase family protein [Gemmatimonadales bacterium]